MVPKGKKHATKLKSVAEACRKRLWRQWTQAGAKEPPTRSMAHWIEQFQRWNEITAAASWARYNADTVRKFCRQAHITQPWEIDVLAIQAYLQSLTLAAGTQARHRSAISKFCRFLMLHRQLEFNPTAATVVPRVYRRPPRFLTGPQVSNLLKAAEGAVIYPAIVLALECGLRVGEIAALRWSDVRGDHLVVGTHKPTKTYRWRTVPLTEAARAALPAPGGDDDPIFPVHRKEWWNNTLKKITKPLPVFGELPGKRVGNQWHLLRSTYAVNQARAGKTLFELMAALGHTNPQTTMAYINIGRAAT